MRHFHLLGLLLICAACSSPEGDNSSDQEKKDQKDADSTQQHTDMTEVEDYPQNNHLVSAHNRAVVFYNVENLFDTEDDPLTSDDEFTPEGSKEWDETRYAKKIDDLAKVFGSISDELPAMIGLCEIENKEVLVELITHPDMKKKNYLIVHEESPDTRGIDVALLFDQDVFKYQFHESLRIDFPWDSDIKTRDILHVVGHFEGEDKVHIFVNHWPSRRDGVRETEPKRMEVAGVLREKLNEIYLDETNPKIIVMGDFNDAPDNKSVEYVMNCLNAESVESGQHDLNEGQLLNLSYPHLLSMDFKHNELGTLVHDGQWEILDQMMCSQGMLSNPEGLQVQSSSSIFNPDWILYKRKDGSSTPNKTYGGTNYYGGYSDHLPVYLILKDAQ